MRAAAFQHERRIRMYDVAAGWALRKDVHCRNLRWTMTDTCSSPDQVWLAYATINPTVHLVRAPLPSVFVPFLSLLSWVCMSRILGVAYRGRTPALQHRAGSGVMQLLPSSR